MLTFKSPRVKEAVKGASGIVSSGAILASGFFVGNYILSLGMDIGIAAILGSAAAIGGGIAGASLARLVSLPLLSQSIFSIGSKNKGQTAQKYVSDRAAIASTSVKAILGITGLVAAGYFLGTHLWTSGMGLGWTVVLGGLSALSGASIGTSLGRLFTLPAIRNNTISFGTHQGSAQSAPDKSLSSKLTSGLKSAFRLSGNKKEKTAMPTNNNKNSLKL